MHPTLSSASRFQDLLTLQHNDSPYAYQSMFKADGWRARRQAKKRFQLLRRIDDAVRPILRDGERIYFLTSGTGVSFWESYFLGGLMYYINRRAILVTDYRIVLLQITSRSRPGVLKSQIQYPAIERVSRSLLGHTKLVMRSGKIQVFSSVPKADRKLLRQIVERMNEALESTSAGPEGLEHLCPHCGQPVMGRPPDCPSCQGRFKSAKKAGLLSLLLPGLGDIYIGHWKFAVLEILVIAIIWLGLLVPDPALPMTAVELVIGGLFIVVVFHGIDALGTWYIARKGLYPQ